MGEQSAKLATHVERAHQVVTYRVMPVIKFAILAVSIGAAIPTARNLYYSWVNGIPFSQVPHRLAQYDLWMKNLDCKIAYKALVTANGSKVDVGACAKTGDIAIKITDKGHSAYEWIAFDQLQKPETQTAALLRLLITPASAAPGERGADTGGAQPAEEGMDVLCRERYGDKVVQIIKDGGKCFREILQPFRGRIEKREAVDCSAHC
jgi:hypothetical protein